MKKLSKQSLVLAAVTTTVLAGLVGASHAGAVEGKPSAATKENVDTAEVAPDSGARTTTTSLSHTHFWGQKNGWWRLQLIGLPVVAGQAVAVSATECPDGGTREWVGDARISVHNVAVENGVVTVRVLVDYWAPVGLCMHYVG